MQSSTSGHWQERPRKDYPSTMNQVPRGYTKLNCQRLTGPSTQTSAWTPPPSPRVTTRTTGIFERHPWKACLVLLPTTYTNGQFAQQGFLSFAFYYHTSAALSKKGSFEIHYQTYYFWWESIISSRKESLSILVTSWNDFIYTYSFWFMYLFWISRTKKRPLNQVYMVDRQLKKGKIKVYVLLICWQSNLKLRAINDTLNESGYPPFLHRKVRFWVDSGPNSKLSKNEKKPDKLVIHSE